MARRRSGSLKGIYVRIRESDLENLHTLLRRHGLRKLRAKLRVRESYLVGWLSGRAKNFRIQARERIAKEMLCDS